MKIVNYLKDVGLLITGVTEIVESEVKEQRGGLLDMLAATLAFILLGSMLIGKGVIRAGQETVWAGQDFWCCLSF